MQIELRGQGSEFDADVKEFSWEYDGDRWRLALPETEAAADYELRLSGPGGPAVVQLDGLESYTANPLVTLADAAWDQSFKTGIRRPSLHHLLEVWQNERWRVFHLLWPIGGASGPPPVPLVTIAQERRGGRWAALAASFDHFAAPKIIPRGP